MLNDMKYIYTIYKEKSFSKAAKKLYISQPALSSLVKKTEKKIGVQIFDRNTIPLTITEEGKYYVEYIEKILNMENDLIRHFKDIGDLKSGNLVIGGSSFFCAFTLPKLIEKFSQKYPNVHIETIEGNIKELTAGIDNGSIDLIIETAISEKDKNLNVYKYSTEEILLGIPLQWKINEKLKKYQLTFEDIKNNKHLQENFPEVSLKHFKKFPFITMKKGNDQYSRGLKMCRKEGFIPKSIFQIDQILTGYHIAISNKNVALFIRDTLIKSAYKNNDSLIYYKVGGDLAKRSIYIANKKNRYISKAMKEFLKIANINI